MQAVQEDGLQEKTQIYVCDINRNMLNVGKRRAVERGNCTICMELLHFLNEICCPENSILMFVTYRSGRG